MPLDENGEGSWERGDRKLPEEGAEKLQACCGEEEWYEEERYEDEERYTERGLHMGDAGKQFLIGCG